MSKKNQNTITFSFGALCPSPSEQLHEHGIRLTKKEEEFIDRINENIIFLSIHGIVTDSETYKARKRLIKRIEKIVGDRND